MISVSKQPLVSVIIPVYNGVEFIGAAIDSALLQTYRNLEVVVVDDGSSDGTLAVLEEYAAKDARVRVITQANGGVARARNRATAEARGELIAPLDADDLWLPSKIDRQVRRLLAAGDETAMVYCWWSWIDEQGNALDRSPRWTLEGNMLETLILINFTGNASVPLIRKHALLEAGGYNEKLAAANAGGCEDWEVVLRLAARHRIAVVPEILLGYRRRPGSMSTAFDTMKRSQQMVMQNIRELRPDLNPALFRGSDNQFAMYLAGLSFRSGQPRQALAWALRAGPRLPVVTAPWVLKMLIMPQRVTEQQTMVAGKSIDTRSIPGPLIPYDRIRILMSTRATATMAWGLLKHAVWVASRPLQVGLQKILLARLRREANYRKAGQLRVFATACWEFPIYSQTFVYRELLGLVSEGFALRFAYAWPKSRKQMPDDCSALWPLRRLNVRADVTADRDLEHYRGHMPQRVAEVARRLAEASGMTEEEIYAHRDFRQAFSFTRMAEAWQADYIHTYFFYDSAIFGFVASTLLAIPRGVSCYADHMMDDYDLKLVGFHMKTCAVVVATSARIKRELEMLAGEPLPQAVVKPNGIDSRSFTPSTRPPSGPGRIFRGVAVNRIHAKKGMTYLVEAVRLLRDRGVPFTVEVCGEYDALDPNGAGYFAELKRFVAEHKLESSVLFRGRRSAAEVKQHLYESDIFVAPFIELANGDKDGIPTALLEAMAAGCAIVATDAGSITEVFDDGVQGLRVPQCDAESLANAIQRLIADDALRARLAEAAKIRVLAEFDVSVCEVRFHERIRAAVAAGQTQAAR